MGQVLDFILDRSKEDWDLQQREAFHRSSLPCVQVTQRYSLHVCIHRIEGFFMSSIFLGFLGTACLGHSLCCLCCWSLNWNWSTTWYQDLPSSVSTQVSSIHVKWSVMMIGAFVKPLEKLPTIPQVTSYMMPTTIKNNEQGSNVRQSVLNTERLLFGKKPHMNQ